ncbi:MAG: hypothetical protein H8D75_01785, partial [Rhodospirillaceae bacterium]|nr:hypothetical protein [Rhodospirillaceae bacterium]
ALLEERHLLFSYPVRSENEFEMADYPVSQGLLMASCRKVGCQVDGEMALIGNAVVTLPEPARQGVTHVIIHPMISSIDDLPDLVAAYRRRYPGALIVLQNSDQHQHEKLIGGPLSDEISVELLKRMPQVDWVLRGFSEHTLISLLLDLPTQAARGKDGQGKHPSASFTLDSLPQDFEADEQACKGRSIRVQRSRGCLSGCTYCIEGQANKSIESERSWDGVPIEHFVDRLERLGEKGFFFINVIDSSFEDPGKRGLDDLRRFCGLLIERQLKFSFKLHLRAENIIKLCPDDLTLMKKAGVDVIVSGLESGEQTELDYYRKIASTETNRQACIQLEEQNLFCNIFGHMMFAPMTTLDIYQEKITFLHSINRCWDFLNMTNRLLVFWGTRIHQQIIEDGLAERQCINPGWVDYRFKDSIVGRIDKRVNEMKKQRPEFLDLNNLIYDSMNLESRLLNPANAHYLDMAADRFSVFRERLNKRKSLLNDLYRDGFQKLAGDPDDAFLEDGAITGEAESQRRDITSLLKFADDLEEKPETLFLHTWLSSVNRFGVGN